MKLLQSFRIGIFLVGLILIGQPLMAQDHGEVGVFANYFRFSDPPRNFMGLGGRLSIGVSPHVQLEGELAYDFEQVFVETFSNPSTGAVAFQRSPVRIMHGLFGAAYHTGTSPVRGFLMFKGGLINFRFDDRPATFGTFVSSFDDVRLNDIRGVFYPGAGLTFYAGPFGFRLEIGDEIFFLDGARNNLRITVGPTIRF